MNNDRLKFRVFDKKFNRFVPEGELFLSQAGYVYYQREYEFEGLPGVEGGIYGEDAVIQQCTGLKDRNDKLIFEGDILLEKEAIDRGDGHKDDCLHTVIWSEERYSLVARPEGTTFQYSPSLLVVEIIGNIFENKELLDD